MVDTKYQIHLLRNRFELQRLSGLKFQTDFIRQVNLL